MNADQEINHKGHEGTQRENQKLKDQKLKIKD